VVTGFKQPLQYEKGEEKESSESIKDSMQHAKRDVVCTIFSCVHTALHAVQYQQQDGKHGTFQMTDIQTYNA